MRIDEKAVTLRNGVLCTLRGPGENDAAKMLEHLKLTSGETDNMARYADEITMTEEAERQFLKKLAESKRGFMVLAYIGDELVASAGVNTVAPYERYAHRGEFGISIKKKFWNMGIGSAVMEEIIAVARLAGYEQLDLEVVATNKNAIRLYEKFGFVTFGRQEHSFKYRDGTYAAQLLMALEL